MRKRAACTEICTSVNSATVPSNSWYVVVCLFVYMFVCFKVFIIVL